jgi:hypothetical protein
MLAWLPGLEGELHFVPRFIIALATLALAPAAFAQTDPLPSWNNGLTKKAIVDFVTKVTEEDGDDYVPPPTASPPSTMTGRCGMRSRSTSTFSRLSIT